MQLIASMLLPLSISMIRQRYYSVIQAFQLSFRHNRVLSSIIYSNDPTFLIQDVSNSVYKPTNVQHFSIQRPISMPMYSHDEANHNEDSLQKDTVNGVPQQEPDSTKTEEVKLYLGNLSYDTDEHHLRNIFEEFGNVTDVAIPLDRDTNRPRGFGFVTFDSRQAAEEAILNLDQTELDGRMIRVNVSRPREPRGGGRFNSAGASDVKLYVGNLNFDTEEETVRELFERYGNIVDYFRPTDRETGRVKGFAFVTMSANDAENAAGKLDGEELDGRNIYVKESQPKGQINGGSRGGRYNDGGAYENNRGDGYNDRGGGYRNNRGGGYNDRGGGYGNRRGGEGGRGYDDQRGGGGNYDDRGGYGPGEGY